MRIPAAQYRRSALHIPGRRHLAAGLLVILGLVAPSGIAVAEEPDALSAVCGVPGDMVASPHGVPRTLGKLRRGEAVRIVAIGSSSTFGTGASARSASYPSRLEASLERLFPQSSITVVNRGVPGDTSTGMVARFRRDAVETKPDLIIWQTGTNSALGRSDIDQFARDVHQGIAMARSAGIEIMLMGPQFAPRFEAAPNRMAYVEKLRAIAAAERIPMFPRYQIMRHWIQTGQFTLATMIGRDGLHLTDQSYACTGWLVARMISGAGSATAHAGR
ncbi:MAG TPA: SGNH/GDSL hydrolase family protein [Alphaproteobacteria bacterium]